MGVLIIEYDDPEHALVTLDTNGGKVVASVRMPITEIDLEAIRWVLERRSNAFDSRVTAP